MKSSRRETLYVWEIPRHFCVPPVCAQYEEFQIELCQRHDKTDVKHSVEHDPL